MEQAENEKIIQRSHLLDNSLGIGLWSAMLVDGDAMHPESEWVWSPEFRRLIGYDSSAEFPDVVQSWSDRLHPDDVEATFAAFAGHLTDLTDRTRYNVTYRLKVADGSYRWFRATGGCKHLENGFIYACGSLSDVHEAVELRIRVEKQSEEMASAVERVSAVTSAIASGDLTGRVEGPFPVELETLKRDLNESVSRLAQILNDVKSSSLQMSGEAEGLAEDSREIARRSQTQAAAVEQTAAAIEQISANIKLTSDNAQEANALASQAKDRSARGTEMVDKLIEAMASIQTQSEKMSDMTKVIEGFAFQTNLLAINAAVEAAHVGDAGQGFAVVANEVRILAQKSEQASKSINELLMDSEASVKAGAELVKGAGEVLADIDGSVDTVVARVGEIANATSEQAVGVSEISNAISEIDGATQSNLELAERYSDSAGHLAAELSDLSQTVGALRCAPDTDAADWSSAVA